MQTILNIDFFSFLVGFLTAGLAFLIGFFVFNRRRNSLKKELFTWFAPKDVYSFLTWTKMDQFSVAVQEFVERGRRGDSSTAEDLKQLKKLALHQRRHSKALRWTLSGRKPRYTYQVQRDIVPALEEVSLKYPDLNIEFNCPNEPILFRMHVDFMCVGLKRILQDMCAAARPQSRIQVDITDPADKIYFTISADIGREISSTIDLINIKFMKEVLQHHDYGNIAVTDDSVTISFSKLSPSRQKTTSGRPLKIVDETNPARN